MNEDIKLNLNSNLINNVIIKRIVNNKEVNIIVGHFPKNTQLDKKNLHWVAALTIKDLIRFNKSPMGYGLSKEEAINKLLIILNREL